MGRQILAAASLSDMLGEAIAFASWSHLPVAEYLLVRQLVLPIIVAWSMALFGERYTMQEILGISVVLAGILIAMSPLFAGEDATVVHGGHPYVLVCFASTFPLALGFALKEKVFRDYISYSRALSETALNELPSPGRRAAAELAIAHPVRSSQFGEASALDVCITQAIMSQFNLLWTPFALAFAVWLQSGLSERGALEFLSSAVSCAAGVQPDWDGSHEDGATCKGLWPKTAAHLSVNLFYTVAVLATIRDTSALLGLVSTKLVTPISCVLFALPLWNILDMPSQRSWGIESCSLLVMLLGLLIFRHGTEVKERRPVPTGCCWPAKCGSRT